MWKSALTIAVCAFGVYYYRVNNNKTPISFQGGRLYPNPPRSSTLTASEISDYHRDGFILKRGLVTGTELETLVEAGEKLYNSWSFLDFLIKSSFAKLALQVWRENEPFARLAMESNFPDITAELLGEKQSVRILKDGFFGFKSTNNTGCGFHVDDKGFWPAQDDSTGVNFWLALSKMRVSDGGGIRVVNQSLSAPFAEECKAVIRARAGMYNQTCNMQELSPSCHDRLLEASVTYDMEPGDALIWDRWTFHRSEPFLVETDQHKLRYTIRYIPGSAKAEGQLHQSVKPGEIFHGAYYPQVWPTAKKEEIDAIRNGIEPDFVISPMLFLKSFARRLGISKS